MLSKLILQDVLLLHILLCNLCLFLLLDFLSNLVSLLSSNAQKSKQDKDQENKNDDCQNHNYTYYDWKVISPKALDSGSTSSLNTASVLTFLVDVAVGLLLKVVHHLLHVACIFRGAVVSVTAI